jgi:hypothetical protein
MSFFGEADPKLMPLHFFHGARELLYATADRADVNKQNYCVAPRHWYITAVIPCIDCRQDFTFSTSEQRFWYEELQFYVDSFPNRCPACRKQQRHMLELKQRYDSLISAALGRSSAEEKRRAINLINELESLEYQVSERMKHNRALLTAQVANLEGR